MGHTKRRHGSQEGTCCEEMVQQEGEGMRKEMEVENNPNSLYTCMKLSYYFKRQK